MPPACLFGDQLDFLPDSVQEVCRNPKHKKHNNTFFESTLPFCTAKAKAWCLQHGRECVAKEADVHTTGPQCTDHSLLGKREGCDGTKARFALAWMCHRRTLREKVVVHENVVQYGDEPLMKYLGSYYLMIRLVLCPKKNLGWPVSRARQCVVMFRKDWLCMLMRTMGVPCNPTTAL